MKRHAAVIGAFCTFAVPASAGLIERACLTSERGTGQGRICGCLQGVANLTLSAQDQKRAASFFADPEKAQKARTSDRRRDEAFWDRYRAFGETAQDYCKN